MSDSFDLLITGGLAATPSGIAEADIGVVDGRIAAIGSLGTARAAEILDARGLHVLPGVIDTQVHFREPGNEHKEDLETGSRAAALGGVTAVFEMPNTQPPTTTLSPIGARCSSASSWGKTRRRRPTRTATSACARACSRSSTRRSCAPIFRGKKTIRGGSSSASRRSAPEKFRRIT